MVIKTHRKLIVPFLMGQRRQGLCRVQEIDSLPWDIVDVPDLQETAISDRNEQLRRMGLIYERLSKAVAEIASQGALPVSIAGDCVSSMGMLSGLQKAGKEPDRILWLDAHGDFHTWETTQTQYIGGMPLAMLVGRVDRRKGDHTDATLSFMRTVGFTPFPEDRIVLSDARDLDPGEITAVLASKIIRCKIADISKYLLEGEKLYLHWDTDVIDAKADMPALKYHVTSGPDCSEMRELFLSLRDQNIVGVSVSAWHAEKDNDNKTATACLRLLQTLGIDVGL